MEGTEPYKAILGMGFPLHKPYPYSLYRSSYLHGINVWWKKYGETTTWQNLGAF